MATQPGTQPQVPRAPRARCLAPVKPTHLPAPLHDMRSQVKGKVKRPTKPDDTERNAQVQLLQDEIVKYINRCGRRREMGARRLRSGLPLPGGCNCLCSRGDSVVPLAHGRIAATRLLRGGLAGGSCRPLACRAATLACCPCCVPRKLAPLVPACTSGLRKTLHAPLDRWPQAEADQGDPGQQAQQQGRLARAAEAARAAAAAAHRVGQCAGARPACARGWVHRRGSPFIYQLPLSYVLFDLACFAASYSRNG